MQQPTLTNVRIRSTRDALQIFYAVARNILPIISRRLDAEERRAIVPGNVYVWEERCANAEATGLGMERWTDGMGWGPSRVRDVRIPIMPPSHALILTPPQEFLFYHQRESEANEDPENPSAKRREPRVAGPSYSRVEAERLIKQTYSVHVTLPEDRHHSAPRKWHLTAYFSQTTLDSLMTLDKIPNVGNVPVPRGLFRSARAGKARRTDVNHPEEVIIPPQDPWGGPTPHPHDLGLAAPPYGYDRQEYTDDSHQWAGPSHAPPSHPHQKHPSHAMHQDHHEFSRGYVPPSVTSTPSTFPPRLPTLTDAGLELYRDPSPFAQGSSASSSDASASPPPFSAPSTFPPTARPRTTAPELNLVPLSFLENIRPPSRDPLDEDLLRRITTANVSNTRYAHI
ncbi:Gti1/Pac2 family-domain-containing protein [Cristinia sonorae]|uniref:Gti1/Pac2 family-domain-containing protein n=1 Tax=Cristinia sonorae TaxID=1940300 RepID=A0A8K0UQH0_9AGAR|nr:Gti1/Pac2 family-domain-containing protein [Cristinia sonorae]